MIPLPCVLLVCCFLSAGQLMSWEGGLTEETLSEERQGCGRRMQQSCQLVKHCWFKMGGAYQLTKISAACFKVHMQVNQSHKEYLREILKYCQALSALGFIATALTQYRMESSYKPCISNIEEVASIGVIRSCVCDTCCQFPCMQKYQFTKIHSSIKIVCQCCTVEKLR